MCIKVVHFLKKVWKSISANLPFKEDVERRKISARRSYFGQSLAPPRQRPLTFCEMDVCTDAYKVMPGLHYSSGSEKLNAHLYYMSECEEKLLSSSDVRPTFQEGGGEAWSISFIYCEVCRRVLTCSSAPRKIESRPERKKYSIEWRLFCTRCAISLSVRKKNTWSKY